MKLFTLSHKAASHPEKWHNPKKLSKKVSFHQNLKSEEADALQKSRQQSPESSKRSPTRKNSSSSSPEMQDCKPADDSSTDALRQVKASDNDCVDLSGKLSTTYRGMRKVREANRTHYEIRFHQKNESRWYQLLVLLSRNQIDSVLTNSEKFIRSRQ